MIDRGKVVFERKIEDESEIYLINANGTNEKRIIKIGNWPKWSPDGRRITFTKPIDGYNHVFICNEDGSSLIDLGLGSFSCWSPDGSQISFACPINLGNKYCTSIFIMNNDGSNRRQLTTGYGPGDFSPAWKPDSFQIAYATSSGICAYNLRTNENKILIQEGRSPAWSPDNSKLIFKRKDQNIYISNENGENELFLCSGELPSFSPDGNMVIYSKSSHPKGYVSEASKGHLYIINIDRTNDTELTKSAYLDQSSSWAFEVD
jgi:Tol biopolymer transport system component